MTAQPTAPGSVRHTLARLGGAALAAESALALVGGLPAAAGGLAVITAAALITARYVSGAEADHRVDHRQVRMMTAREPGLGEWYWTVTNGLATNGYPHPLQPQLRRLYTARLSERHGVSLYDEPEQAAALVGPELWPWLDPARPAPRRTVTPRVLRALVDRLDSL